MANDNKVKIQIETTADTRGAELVEKSLFKIGDAAKQAERELDVLEAKRRQSKRGKRGVLGTDLTGGIGEGSLEGAAREAGFGRELDGAKKLAQVLGVEVTPAIVADAAAIGGAFVAIGASAVASYNLLSNTVTGYKSLMSDAKAAGVEIGPDLARQVAVLEETLLPVETLIDTISEKWDGLLEMVKNPVDTLSGLGDLKDSIARQVEVAEKLKQLRLKIVTDRQGGLISIYGEELAKLNEQETALRRIAELRSGLGGLAVQGARQEVESAKLRGGDVGLAEANALAAELRAGLGRLGDSLTDARASAATARTQYDGALVLYQTAITDGIDKLDPAKFQQLSAGVDAAKKAFDDSNQAVADQSQLYEASKNNLLRGAENKLAKLEQDLDGEISKAAGSVFDGVYQTIRDEVSKGPAEAVGKIQAATQPIAEAANNKAAEVNGAISQAATSVNEKGSQIVTVFDEFRKASESKDDRIIRGLENIVSTMKAFSSRMDNTEREINKVSQQVSNMAGI